ncbi:zinc finger BED domain-containing protein RICESLEEPER 2-like [Rhizophagus clarus]|uniref:Zinc finger BED domain-containing protein RICESLEEPER 2-like n=1 Tax=Rhizophagus clarus TaxID=94130 RepID=A0A8H3QRD7_9GLOM|nr:zinc finger BED domain-containing protein RICESLEEPER 2-like [Rhizophagus clarus]
MNLQNKRVKYDARLIKDSTNRTGNTDKNELQHYTESRYFVDDIDDINDDINDDIDFVWKYFKKGEDSNSATCYMIKEDGEECGHYYNDGSTTSNLIHHLATKHKIYKPGSAEQAKHLKEQPQLDIRVAIKKRKPKSETEYKQIRQNVDCIAASITTDFWTSKAWHGYIGVTCSWISHDWTLCEALLALQRVRYSHTGEIIKELLNKIFADWAIASKLLTMTTDNGNLNKDAQKDGEKLEKIMLSDDEWLLIEDLLNLLSVFEDVTKLLSGAKYFLKNNIQVKEEHLNIFREQEITGYSLLITTEEKFKSYELKEGPAMILVDFAHKCKEKSSIPQFTPHSSSEVELDNALMN